jgi:hypothetical protein
MTVLSSGLGISEQKRLVITILKCQNARADAPESTNPTRTTLDRRPVVWPDRVQERRDSNEPARSLERDGFRGATLKRRHHRTKADDASSRAARC